MKPVALALTACSSTKPTAPTAATMSCTLTNTGGTAASSISYTTATGTTVSGPTGACAAGASCGTVTVTSATTAGSYSGTLTAKPNVGTAGTAAVSLEVYLIGGPGTFAVLSGVRLGTFAIVTVQNTGAGTISGISATCLAYGFITSGPSASTLAPGATLTITAMNNYDSTTQCRVMLWGSNASNSPYFSPYF